MKLFFDNSDQYISGDSAPDLCFDSVSAIANETLDAQMLLDPLEEQFDLPSAFVQRRNRQCRQCRVVGQEPQCFAGFWIFEADASELLGIIPRDAQTIECDALITDDAGTSVDFQ